MNKFIFKRAKNAYQAGMVRRKEESSRKIYYSVDDIESGKEHQVTLENTDKGTIITCTCTEQSLHSSKLVLCSHMIMVIIYEYFHTGVR
jgi:hypothetical protein